ncbi:MAG: hypothetical protein H6737_30305 [Alphaproteobacteria bacterium]|nr:hypothetical protein [Alphaproteobacteria bacterium]
MLFAFLATGLAAEPPTIRWFESGASTCTWREKALPDGDVKTVATVPSSCEHVEVHYGVSGAVLVRAGEGRWRIVDGASPTAVPDPPVGAWGVVLDDAGGLVALGQVPTPKAEADGSWVVDGKTLPAEHVIVGEACLVAAWTHTGTGWKRSEVARSTCGDSLADGVSRLAASRGAMRDARALRHPAMTRTEHQVLAVGAGHVEFRRIEGWSDGEPPYAGLPLKIGALVIPVDDESPEAAIALQARGDLLLVGRPGVEEVYGIEPPKVLWSSKAAQATTFWPAPGAGAPAN